MFGLGTFGTLTFAQARVLTGAIMMSAGTGVFVLAGQSLSPLGGGTFVLAGQAAYRNDGIPSGAGSFALSGQTATFKIVQAMDVGAFVLTGNPATLGFLWSAQFSLSGEAAVEFVGTTRFIDMIEQGEAEIGIAAEIRTRSL